MSVEHQVKLSGWSKVFFGAGAIGEAVYLGLFNSFIQIFYNQAIGLTNTLIGAAIMLAMIGDAITDPVVGLMSDRWRSRHGRRHPFLFVAPLPLALSLWFIFHPPEFLVNTGGDPNQLGLFLWLVVLTIASRAFLTLYSVPHLALGGELSRDQHQRAQLFSVNSIIGYMSGAGFAFVAWSFFLSGERLREGDGMLVPGQLDPAAYTPLVLLGCCVVLASIWLSAAGTYKHIKTLSVAQPAATKLSVRQVFREIVGTLRNRNYVILMIGFFFFMFASGIFDTLNVHVVTYFWEMPAESIRWIALAGVPAAMTGAFLAPVLMKRFDRKPVLLGALGGIFVFSQLAVDLRLLGIMPANGDPLLLPALMANAAGLSSMLGMASVTIMSMIGDVIDESELATRLRQEGLFYSARAFFAKASYSFGHLFAGIMLDAFVRLPAEAFPGQLDDGVLFRMGLTAGPIMAVSALLAWFTYFRYDLTRERHMEIMNEIRSRPAVQKGDA
jgi:Na+/melibiose symporter-like transporter